MAKALAVLAFSGGLDTSFCVPYLRERGYDVATLFVDTGGAGAGGAEKIAARAKELGAVEHVRVDVAERLWESFVVPFVMGGEPYQGRYPLLCSDRYLIVEETVKLAERLGASAIAHGCTAMGNDQVRFDQSIRCLSDLPILAPIREIQKETKTPRKYEIAALKERGFEVSADVSRYTINENMLGVTVSGSEIDEMGAPSDESRRLTAPPQRWPREAMRVAIGFERGEAVSLDGEWIGGPALLGELNRRFGAYGVGRGIYTGDTIVGLKGRIAFEAPGLTALLEAHRSLEELTLTATQNAFKPQVAKRWTELVFGGLFFDPLRSDLEAFLRSTQRLVSGEVTVETAGGSCTPVAVDSPNILRRRGAVYAQSSDWTAADAEGFIKLYGQASAIAAAAHAAAGESRAPAMAGAGS